MIEQFRNTKSGSCYILGKGESINNYEFDDRFRIGINDVGVIYRVDIGICGPDAANKIWLLKSELHKRIPVLAPISNWALPGMHLYQPRIMLPLIENTLYNKGRVTISSAIALAKTMGFDSAIVVGVGDEYYAEPWRSKYRKYNQIDQLTNRRDKPYRDTKERKQFAVDIGNELEIEIEVI
jgi:hypothetical protein